MKTSKLGKLIIVSLLMCNFGGIHSAWAETTTTDVNPSVDGKLGKSAVANNVVTVEGTTATATGSGATANWTSAIDGWGDVYGGRSENSNGDAVGNTVTINGGSFPGKRDIHGGYSINDNASENHVIINAFDAGDYAVYGGRSDNGEANGNIVDVNGPADFSIIYGGYVQGGNVKNNVVNVYNGEITTVYGGCSEAANGNAEGNQVNIYGGTIGYSLDDDGEIIGGMTTVDAVCPVKNIVTIYGGNIKAVKIVGGYAAGKATVQENTVRILGGTFDADKTMIYGGLSDEEVSIIRYNNLSIEAKNIKVKGVQGVQNYQFVLPEDTKSGDVMLTIKDALAFSADDAIRVQVESCKLKQNDVVTLISSEGGISGVDKVTKQYRSGVKDIKGEITCDDGKNMNFIMLDSGFNAETAKVPVEGVAAGIAMVNEGGNLAVGQGMMSLITETGDGTVPTTFGAMGGGKSKYNTGSHVDSRGFSLMVGAGKAIKHKNGRTTIPGLYFEYGRSNIDTFNGAFTGDGNTNYKGVGFMVRHDLTNGQFLEGSIRVGKSAVDWRSSNFEGGSKYDTNSTYYGFHFGVGKDIRLNVKSVITPYARYTYTRTSGDSAKIAGYDYDFEAVKSHRVKLGARYAWKKANQKQYPYVGLAWEHEFDSEAKAAVAGLGNVNAPSVKGNSGVVEIGWRAKAGKWDLGIGVEGFVGKRQGYTGSINAFYNF